jgi:predicted DNA binding CopG/RHH family protein
MNSDFFVSVKNKKFHFKINGPYAAYDQDNMYKLSAVNWDYEDEFTADDLMRFLASGDLQYFILEELKQKEVADQRLQFRVTKEEKLVIEKKAFAHGKNTSTYLRELALSE